MSKISTPTPLTQVDLIDIASLPLQLHRLLKLKLCCTGFWGKRQKAYSNSQVPDALLLLCLIFDDCCKIFSIVLTLILNQVYIGFQCSPLFKDRQTGLVGNSRLVPLFLGAWGLGLEARREQGRQGRQGKQGETRERS